MKAFEVRYYPATNYLPAWYVARHGQGDPLRIIRTIGQIPHDEQNLHAYMARLYAQQLVPRGKWVGGYLANGVSVWVPGESARTYNTDDMVQTKRR